jgi:hypothetical protein
MIDKYCPGGQHEIVQNSESVLMDMFLPVVSTENDDNEITIIEENIPTTRTIKRIKKLKEKVVLNIIEI